VIITERVAVAAFIAGYTDPTRRSAVVSADGSLSEAPVEASAGDLADLRSARPVRIGAVGCGVYEACNAPRMCSDLVS
jgi:hypothetical protein